MLLLLAFTLAGKSVTAQIGDAGSPRPMAPGGYLDTLFDRFGNKYSLGQIAIPTPATTTVTTPGGGTYLPLTPGSGCDPGYFQVFYEVGSGFADGETNYLANRAVLCQVLSDISALISSPLTTTGQKVNIWVRNIDNMGPAAAPFAGVAHFLLQCTLLPNKNGVADNTTWLIHHIQARTPLLILCLLYR